MRYSDRMGDRGRGGIRVGGESSIGGRHCRVTFSADTKEEAMGWSDESMGVLIARGFVVERLPGFDLLTVREGSGADVVEDAVAVASASELDIARMTQNIWHVAVNGQRGAYEIKRTGSGDRTRFAVNARGSGSVARNLRTMQEATDAVRKELRDGVEP